jgi:hypothetical protein
MKRKRQDYFYSKTIENWPTPERFLSSPKQRAFPFFSFPLCFTASSASFQDVSSLLFNEESISAVFTVAYPKKGLIMMSWAKAGQYRRIGVF